MRLKKNFRIKNIIRIHTTSFGVPASPGILLAAIAANTPPAAAPNGGTSTLGCWRSVITCPSSGKRYLLTEAGTVPVFGLSLIGHPREATSWPRASYRKDWLA